MPKSKNESQFNYAKQFESDSEMDQLEAEKEATQKQAREDFAALLGASSKKTTASQRVRPGQKIRAEILLIGKEEIFFSTGTPNDGVMQRRDLEDENKQIPYKVGDTVELYVASTRGDSVLLTKTLADVARLSGLSRLRKSPGNERDTTRSHFLAENKVGDVVPGRVTRIEKFGAFIELAPGLDGLAHVSELRWSRVADPTEVLTVGEHVRVKIVKVEVKEGGKTQIGLSIKQCEAQPWDNIPAHVKVGSVVNGKVTRLAQFGAFVEVAPGLEGLVPLSEMSHTRRVLNAEEVVKPGERIDVKIKDISRETKRIALSIKDAGEDPWALAASKYHVGRILKATVEKKETFGVFMIVEEGITALLPRGKAKDAVGFSIDSVRKGDVLELKVLDIKPDERRMTLTLPSDDGASSDEWKGYATTTQTPSSSFGGAFASQLQAALKKNK